MSIATKEELKTTKPNQAQLRNIRISIYKKNVKARPLNKGINGEVFHVPESLVSRQKNFKEFVSENFVYGMDRSGIWPDVITGLPVYKKLKEYSETTFGAAMIYRVLQDNKKRKLMKKPLFAVEYDDGKAGQNASAGFNYVRLSRDFPNSMPYTGGEKKYYPAIIHHEFGHTRFFNMTQNPNISRLDERQAVIHLENPIRMKQGYEPRYTYKQSSTTIIITGNDHPKGFDTVNESDPSKPMKIGTKGAYRR